MSLMVVPPHHPKGAQTEIHYRYGEDVVLKELQTYVDSTYQSHYASGIQVGEFLEDHGWGETYYRANIIKYAARQGQKEGQERKDILKILHYAMMWLHAFDKNQANKTTSPQLSQPCQPQQELSKWGAVLPCGEAQQLGLLDTAVLSAATHGGPAGALKTSAAAAPEQIDTTIPKVDDDRYPIDYYDRPQ